MRTLICEFQPFVVETRTTLKDYGMVEEFRSGSPGKHYNYAYCGNKPVKKGDWALVHNGTNFGITAIKRVIPGIDPKVTKHVIEVLTKEEFEAYQERNKKIDELRSDMDELEYRLEQHKKLSRYEDLAKEDPRAKTLLDRMKEAFGITDMATISPPSPAAEAAPTLSEEPL